MKHLYGDAVKGQEKIENIYVEFISNKLINNIFFFVFDQMFYVKSVFSEVNWWSKFETSLRWRCNRTRKNWKYLCGIHIKLTDKLFMLNEFRITKEKPANSFWSRFIINTLSIGLKLVFSEVNWRSKFETSLQWRCKRTRKIWKHLCGIHIK